MWYIGKSQFGGEKMGEIIGMGSLLYDRKLTKTSHHDLWASGQELIYLSTRALIMLPFNGKVFSYICGEFGHSQCSDSQANREYM